VGGRRVEAARGVVEVRKVDVEGVEPGTFSTFAPVTIEPEVVLLASSLVAARAGRGRGDQSLLLERGARGGVSFARALPMTRHRVKGGWWRLERGGQRRLDLGGRRLERVCRACGVCAGDRWDVGRRVRGGVPSVVLGHAGGFVFLTVYFVSFCVSALEIERGDHGKYRRRTHI
jgi:hypothetical protein